MAFKPLLSSIALNIWHRAMIIVEWVRELCGLHVLIDLFPILLLYNLWVVREGPIYTNIYLQDLNGMSEIYLGLTDLANIYFFIHVSFITRLGFVFDPSRQIYSCFASERMLCNKTTLEVCIQKGFWYGELQGGGNDTMNTVAPCSP